MNTRMDSIASKIPPAPEYNAVKGKLSVGIEEVKAMMKGDDLTDRLRHWYQYWYSKIDSCCDLNIHSVS